MGSVDHAEVAFGAGLAGVLIVHMTDIVQAMAHVAGAEEAWTGEGGSAGLLQAVCVRLCFPTAMCDPFKLRLVWMGPAHQGNLIGPASGVFHTAEEVG